MITQQIKAFFGIARRSAKALPVQDKASAAYDDSTDTSFESLGSHMPQNRLASVVWVLSWRKRLRLHTVYLAVTFLRMYFKAKRIIKGHSLEAISCAAVLMASKMNDIYAVQVQILINSCSQFITETEVIDAEAQICNTLNWNLCVDGTAYSYLSEVYGDSPTFSQAERLLCAWLGQTKTDHQDDHRLALAIVFLFQQARIAHLPKVQFERVRKLAISIYQLRRQKGKAKQLNTIRR